MAGLNRHRAVNGAVAAACAEFGASLAGKDAEVQSLRQEIQEPKDRLCQIAAKKG